MTELNKNPELTVEEVSAMQAAEAEVIAFYDEVDEWDEECERLTFLRKFVSVILHSRQTLAYTFNHSETRLTYDEKEILTTVSKSATKEATSEEVQRVTQILKWACKVNSAYSSMRRGTLETVIGVPNALIMEIK